MFLKTIKNSILLVALLFGIASFGQFNTIVKDTNKRVVSTLETVNSAPDDTLKMDSVSSLLKMKKIEYNMGVLPLDDIYVTSSYGIRKHPITGVTKPHYGVDMRADKKLVYAVQKGVIKEVGYDTYLGEYIKLECGAFEFIYGHLEHIYVSSGSVVKMGQRIGKTGATGRVTAKHLHFAIKNNDTFLDPYPILQLIYENLDFGSATGSE